MIKLSVVIPTFNRRRVLERTLPSLAAQDLSFEDYEVIVAVNGSTDGTQEFLSSWKPKHAFRWFEVPRKGAGAARNAGIQAAIGDLVLFLDDDLIAIPDLLRQHCEAHLNKGPQVVHGPIYVAEGSSKTVIRRITELFYAEYNRGLTSDLELRYPGGIGPSISMLSSMVNSSMPREYLLRCGGFDEAILAAEDLDLGLRLWKMGLPLRCRPSAFTREFYIKSSENYLKYQAKSLGAGDLRVCQKHPEYRPYSGMASFAHTRIGKRWLRNVVMRFPLSPVPLLSFPLRLEKWFYEYVPLRNAGVELFRIAERITRLRSSLNAAGSWNALVSAFDRRVPGLMYHHIGPFRPGSYREWSISPTQFERQIRWLSRRGFSGITPSDWLHWRKTGRDLPKRPILITFDDAYADTAEYAFPILRKYGFKAAVFVVSQRIGGTNTWDEVQGCGTLKLMPAESIRHWARQGLEFGAHGRTHAELTKLTASECSKEIKESKKDIEHILGVPIVAFAYPHGEYSASVYKMVKDEYDVAFGSDEGMNYLRDDPHLLRRAYVGPDMSLIAFALTAHYGSLSLLRDLRVRFGIRSRMKKTFKRLFHTSSTA